MIAAGLQPAGPAPARLDAHTPPTMLREALRDARVFVVDDSPSIRATIRSFLRRSGLENVIEAEDGLAALERMEQIAPDLVITDLLMPRLDGLDLCRRLRADDRWREVPILVQTGASSLTERGDVFAEGATDLINKPLNLREMIGRVRVHLEQRWLVRELSAHQEAMRLELAMAREMQEALLPTARALAEIQSAYPVTVASRYRASKGLGGDLWRLSVNETGLLGISMVDFAGHGIAAALNTFRLDSFLRSAEVPNLPLHDAMGTLNAFLCDVLPRGHFATMLAMRFDFAAGTLEMASAGGPPPLLDIGGTGRFEVLPSAGFPLGILATAPYETQTYPFPPGSTLLLYSDALIDTPLAPEAVFDSESLAAYAGALGGAIAPADLVRAIEDALLPNVPDDDLTIVAMRHREDV